jgi:uncharacterized membrane protein
VGIREIVTGAGILAGVGRPIWLWARVAGDIMDLALLGRSFRSRRANRPKLLASVASVAGVLALDAITAAQLSRRNRREQRQPGRIHVRKAITINREPAEVYRFWHDLQNLPRFMENIDSIRVANGRSRWRARGPAGIPLEWDAEMVHDRPNELLGWRSLEGSDVLSSGIVEIAPAGGGRGTVVRVDLRYHAPARRVANTIAKLFGQDPGTQLENDLRRFKQLLETGEVIHSDASIHRGRHPARPPTQNELEAIR